MISSSLEFTMIKALFLILLLGREIRGQMFANLFDTLRIFNAPSFAPEVSFQYEYDFIVVGGGSAGAVVANRLSENGNWTVLLLEAGGEENFLSDVPLLAAMQAQTNHNWGYKSERLKTACKGLMDQRCNTPRGKVLGGTSVINFLLYTRGNKLDYDEWESMGNVGWSYKDVLKYFIKSEDCTRCESIDTDFHGKDGYLKIEHPQLSSPLLKRFLKAGVELGYKNTDPNGRNHIGFSEVQATMRNGRRCSSNKAFITPVINRPTLQVATRARVVKILIDAANKTAYGVEVIKNREKITIRAKREVILSAGTINSPHLLMLSGIGPKEDLGRVNIDVIQDLKVGYNLQDHFAMSTLVFLTNESITVSDLGVQNPTDVFNYVINGKGPYSIPGGALGLGFVKTKYSKKQDDYPDIELVLGAGALHGDVYGTMRNMLGITDETNRKVYLPIRNQPGFSIAAVIMRPKSRGRILIKDKNPLHWPLIIPNYLQQEDDLNVMVEGVKMAIAVSESNAFRDVNASLHNIPFPGCEKFAFNTDDYWKCALRHVGTTLGHHVGTCKMGPASDPNAVVDPRLRVRGIRGLRVVDASIMPNIVAGHTNSVAMMIGEKASDMIKEDWR